MKSAGTKRLLCHEISIIAAKTASYKPAEFFRHADARNRAFVTALHRPATRISFESDNRTASLEFDRQG
ncbi:hypothetical protein [Shinella sp. NM-101]|uniref:hypothetical protein n=1 Tax=Shinella sp. NM-101 TaxID=2744455 RepID=UPI001F2BDA6F|nr:hypothetical protein [Shinella sp. NM-101]